MAGIIFIFLSSLLMLGQSDVRKPHWSGSFTGFSININTDGAYSISVNNVTWFNNAPTFFYADGRRFIAGQELKLIQTTTDGGTDSMGPYTRINFHYQAGSSNIIASIKTYNDYNIPIILFSQRYVNGAHNASTGNRDHTISSFPGFKLDKNIPSNLGCLSYGGIMFGDIGKRIGKWKYSGTNINSGIGGGPLAIFDQSGNTVIISSANNFMSSSMWHETFVDVGGAVHWGIMGKVDQVPARHVVETVIFYHNEGINKAFQGWGDYLRYRYNRDDEYVKSDLTINYLGYWTDNGAYYYYETEDNKNYQNTILDVKAYAEQIKVPYRYIQYDSWWYYKGILDGVKTWVSRPDIFPDGMQYVYNKTGLPVSAHNRFWASDTTYAKQNGGNYNFIVKSPIAVPYEQKFWDDLMNDGRKWGMTTYEQDWLNDEFSGLEAFMTDINLGKLWLTQMGEGAKKNGITIQYCMAYSRQAMQALEIPVVTQARVSIDYSPGKDHWKIGISSIFAYAMGVAPFKDNFWTTTTQPGNPYSRSEPNTELNAAVATISTGPVGPSDKIGYSNASLIMRCCNEDGLILKPGKPATAIDDQILQSALGTGGPMGEVWTTYSDFGILSQLHFGIILAADMTNTYSLTPTSAGFGNITGYKWYSLNNPVVADFSDQSPITITPSCTKVNFCLFYVSPILTVSNREIVILGEMSKWVPVSPQRIDRIVQGDKLVIFLSGSQREMVKFYFIIDGAMTSISCVLGDGGTAKIYVNTLECLAG